MRSCLGWLLIFGIVIAVCAAIVAGYSGWLWMGGMDDPRLIVNTVVFGIAALLETGGWIVCGIATVIAAAWAILKVFA